MIEKKRGEVVGGQRRQQHMLVEGFRESRARGGVGGDNEYVDHHESFM